MSKTTLPIGAKPWSVDRDGQFPYPENIRDARGEIIGYMYDRETAETAVNAVNTEAELRELLKMTRPAVIALEAENAAWKRVLADIDAALKSTEGK